MAYSWGMGEQWLEFQDGQATRRIPLAGSLTRVGGSGTDISMSGFPAGEVHVWSEPPKVVLAVGDARLAVNGAEGRELLLADGDQIEWGGARFCFRGEVVAPILEEIPIAAPAAPAAPTAPESPNPPSVPEEAGSPSRGKAWERVQAGLYVDLGLSNKSMVKRWQESVMSGDFAPDACARDLSSGVVVDPDDPRLSERAARLLRDFLMSSATSGAGGAKRKVRQAGKKGAAFLISQFLVIGVYTLIILAAMLVFRAKGTSFDTLFDGLLPDSAGSTEEG